jgi:hypothetical protein
MELMSILRLTRHPQKEPIRSEFARHSRGSSEAHMYFYNFLCHFHVDEVRFKWPLLLQNMFHLAYQHQPFMLFRFSLPTSLYISHSDFPLLFLKHSTMLKSFLHYIIEQSPPHNAAENQSGGSWDLRTSSRNSRLYRRLPVA